MPLRKPRAESYDLRSAFQEFAVWNLFTGARASLAPFGYRYSEAEEFPMIPDSSFNNYPLTPSSHYWPEWPESDTSYINRVPQNLAANYLRFASASSIQPILFTFSGAQAIPWGITLAELPDNLSNPASLNLHLPSGSEQIIDTLPQMASGSNLIAIPIIASTYDHAYPDLYGYNFSIDFITATDDIPAEQLPALFSLSQNYPNPFNQATRIDFSLPRSSEVKVEIIDLLGRTVTILSEGILAAGHHHVTWDGTGEAGKPLSSGLYFCRLQAGERLFPTR